MIGSKRRHIWQLASAMVASALLTAAGASAARAEYKLAPGDVIELSTSGQVEMRQRAMIGMDGDATLPFAGVIKAAGSTIHEIQTRMQELVSSKLLRQRGEGGREYTTALLPDQINVTIAEYRPVYLSGDVAKPGEYVFRPGLTVRQTIALAGGYDIMRVRMNNPFLEMADIKSDNQTLWIEYARKQAERARLQAELDDLPKLDFSALIKTPAPDDVVASIHQLEQKRFAARREAFEAERQQLTAAIGKEEIRVSTLAQQQTKEREGVEFDENEQQRVQELLNVGRVPITRLIEAKRTALLSATRFLQTVSQVGTVERQRDEITLQLQKLKDTRRLSLMNELQDINVLLANTRNRLEAVGTKLTYTGMVKSQLVGDGATPPEIVIMRTQEGKQTKIEGTEDSSLQPGDVVEIALQKSLVPNTSSVAPPPSN